eukprot:TRINITY_DN4805_c0_g1_i2.p1 TRINITY_DN4805_c0_g1~~TRINITY_DN4805_c0_g1_i2.p1  ORF type:complete len:631 (-),score=143.64 TRINITY_DN4805_c0_g1_i2:109-2001(-)
MNALSVLLIALHWCVVASSVALRRVCRNRSYRLSTSRRYPPNEGPSDELQSSEVDFQRFAGLRMLEIGGPTHGVPFYDVVAAADNVAYENHFTHFHQAATDATGRQLGSDFDGSPYIVNHAKLGKIYKRHGANLSEFADGSYDIVFASHVLEHFVDPLLALHEWDRVLAPGGYLILNLPWAPATMDKLVAPATMQELMHLHKSGASEDDAFLRNRLDMWLRLFPEFVPGAGWPNNAKAAGGETVLEKRRSHHWNKIVSLCRGDVSQSCSDPAVNEGLWHWHVWDFDLLQEVVGDCLAYNILNMQRVHPFHQFVFAQKPLTAPRLGAGGPVALRDLRAAATRRAAATSFAEALRRDGYALVHIDRDDAFARLLADVVAAQRMGCWSEPRGGPLRTTVNVFDGGKELGKPACWPHDDYGPLKALHRAWGSLASFLLDRLAEAHEAAVTGAGAWLHAAVADIAGKQKLLRSTVLRGRSSQDKEGKWAIQQHQDASWLTLLAEAGAEGLLEGLEVLQNSGIGRPLEARRWLAVDPFEGYDLIVFAGAQLSAATKGYFPAWCHRVRRPTRQRHRFSWSFIYPTNICQYFEKWSKSLTSCTFEWQPGFSFPPSACDEFGQRFTRAGSVEVQEAALP